MPSPGEDYQSWSVTALSNGSADPSITWVEGQSRASVNNSARSMLAAHAKNRNLLNGSIVTTGTVNAQAFVSGVSYTSIPTGLRATLKVGGGLTNTASMTLNMDGLGDTLVKNSDGSNLLGNEFFSNGYVDVLYNGTNWIFLYSREFFWEMMTGGGGIIIGTQVFSTAGTFTYTPSSGTECCIIECIGGGGGGGYASSSSTAFFGGGGGGSGSYSRLIADAADIGASQTVNVGAGGAGGTIGIPIGWTGGVTSVGVLCIASGGLGGEAASPGTNTSGGAGGAPGTGDIVAAGAPGMPGAYSEFSTTNSVFTNGGVGGSSAFGGGGNAISTNQNGNPGRNYGAGGSGGNSYAGGSITGGGAGSSGVIIITEFAGRGAPGRDGDAGPIGPVGPSGAGTGDVLRFGTPTVGQIAQWTDASHIQGVDIASTVVSTAVTNVVMQKFIASGTYTPTSGMKFCIIECIGAGGGGGAVNGGINYINGGGGGGAGGYSRKRATAADIGVSKTVTVGAGGAGGSGGGGSNGGVTSVGTLCVANGGNGGNIGDITHTGIGGTGATAGVGDVTATGASGHNATYWALAVDGFAPPAGAGGNSYYGGGGRAGQGTAGGNSIGGGAGTGYGGGGGGASSNKGVAITSSDGGTGSGGLVIVTEFI